MRPVRVKICGITNLHDAQEAVKYGVDALGFIFYKPSPRYVSPRKARLIVKKLPPFVSKVGVFVNSRKEYVEKIAGFVGLDVLQFHGNESNNFCGNFVGRFKLIKSFFPKKKSDLKQLSFYKYVDAFLLDISLADKQRDPCGSINTSFVKEALKYSRYIIVSGGLNIGNIRQILKKTAVPFALDVARGVEKSAGLKDFVKMRKFIKIVKNHGLF